MVEAGLVVKGVKDGLLAGVFVSQAVFLGSLLRYLKTNSRA